MDQSLVHTFSWGSSYGPMVLKVFLKFPPTLVLVHGWFFPDGRPFSRQKLPSRSSTLGEELIRMEETHLFGNDS